MVRVGSGHGACVAEGSILRISGPGRSGKVRFLLGSRLYVANSGPGSRRVARFLLGSRRRSGGEILRILYLDHNGPRMSGAVRLSMGQYCPHRTFAYRRLPMCSYAFPSAPSRPFSIRTRCGPNTRWAMSEFLHSGRVIPAKFSETPIGPNLLRPKCKIRNISQLRDPRSNPKKSGNSRRNPKLRHRTPRNFAEFLETPRISVSQHIAKQVKIEEFRESRELINWQDCGTLRDSWQRATMRTSFFVHGGSGLGGAKEEVGYRCGRGTEVGKADLRKIATPMIPIPTPSHRF